MEGYDIVDPAFRALVLPNARLETLAGGFRWLEGPVWFADQDCLVFGDLPNDRLLRWSEHGGAVTWRAPAGFENGHARDRQGRLVGCSHRHRCITRVEWDGRTTVLADRFEGRRLNSPNDLVVGRDGSIWFTDPPYGIQTDYEGGKQTAELPARVYRLDPADGRLTVVADDFQGPNGLCFSPDERRLYIVETGEQFAADPVQHIRRFEVRDDGGLRGGAVFHRISPGNADGLRCDEAGRVWSSAGDGVHCLSPDDGRLLGRIRVPATVSNLCFGGRALSRLFICAGETLYAIHTNTRGAALL